MLRPSSFLPLAAVALLFAPGCERSLSDPEKSAQARESVRRFFQALPSGDCGQLGRLLVLEGTGHDCREVVDEMNRHELRLVEVLDARVDGRDPNAVIVKTRVSEGGKAKQAPMLLRVEKHSEGWKLRL